MSIIGFPVTPQLPSHQTLQQDVLQGNIFAAVLILDPSFSFFNTSYEIGTEYNKDHLFQCH